MRSPGNTSTIITALNFERESVKEELDFKKLKQLSDVKHSGEVIVNCVADKAEGRVDEDGKMDINLGPWSGKTFSIDTQTKVRRAD